jgi:hypothetical protein
MEAATIDNIGPKNALVQMEASIVYRKYRAPGLLV